MLLLTVACNTFDPGEIRDSPNDPDSNQFIPYQPSEISVSKNNDLITVTWKDNTEYEDGYLIEHAVDDTSSFVEIARINPNSTSYVYKIEEEGLVLYVRVKAFSNNSSDNLPNSLFKTQSAAIPLLDVSNLNAHYSKENLVEISWESPLGVESGYKIYLQHDTTPYLEIGEAANNGERLRTFQFEYPFEDQTIYSFKVIPVKGSITGLTSSISNRLYRKPNPPENVVITSVSESSLKISWNSYQNEPYPQEMIIEKKSDLDSDFLEIARLGGGITTFTDTDLDTSIVYDYRVKTATSNYSYKKTRYKNSAQLLRTHFKKSGVTEMAFNPAEGNTEVATIFFDYRYYGSNRKIAEIWDLQNNLKKHDLAENVRSVNYNSAGTKLIVASFQEVNIYDAFSGTRLFSYPEPGTNKSFTDAVYSSDDKYFALGGSQLTIWDAENNVLLCQYDDVPSIGIQFNPTNSREIAGMNNYSNVLIVVDAADGTEKLRLKADANIHAFSYSPDGRYIATFNVGQLIVWDSNTGEIIREWNFGVNLGVRRGTKGIQFISNDTILLSEHILNIDTGIIENLNISESDDYSGSNQILFKKSDSNYYIANESIEVWNVAKAWRSI